MMKMMSARRTLRPWRAMPVVPMLLGMVAAMGASSCRAESAESDGQDSAHGPNGASRAAGPRPVLVELFTSQGCESCPPADVLLARLEADQPVAGAVIIPIAWHVDYWNGLGWADPYSSQSNTMRQRDYSRAARADTIYTPQMIVDGELGGFNGQDRRKAIRAIKRSAETRKIPMTLTLEIAGGDGESPDGDRGSSRQVGEPLAGSDHKSQLEVTISFDEPQVPSHGNDVLLWVVLTESELGNDIPSGENAGKHLEHTAVVRLATSIKLPPKVPLSPMPDSDDLENRPPRPARIVTLDLSDKWNPENLSVVAFLQENSRTRRVLGVVHAAVSD